MSTYYEKYVKYKNKYLEYKNIGGNNEQASHLVKFINEQDFPTIQEKLLLLMNNQRYCNKILGQGMMGHVISPNVNTKMPVITSSGKKILLPVVVKIANNKGEINIKEFDNKLFIYGYKDITTEAIILSYINQLWHAKLTPHLPYMIGYSCCTRYEDNSIHVDQIIMEKHGLKKNIIQDIPGFNESKFWHPVRKNYDHSILNSPIATLNDLLIYILINNKDNTVKLPNDQTVNIIELLNYTIISYVHTHNLLDKSNIIAHDMHLNNIFIHWLSKNSYLDDEYIGDTEIIYYEFNKKYIKIKTFGMILKIGDVGGFMVLPTNNKVILGQAVNLEENKELLNILTKNNYSIYWFLQNFAGLLPLNIYRETILYNILTKYPYDNLSFLMLPSYKLVEDFKTCEEILMYYEEYFVDEVTKSEKYLVVKDL